MADKLFLVLMLSVVCVTAQDITLSKDTLFIINDIQSSISPDSLTLYNSGTEPMVLDSLIIQIDEMEMEFMIHDAMYIRFSVIVNDSLKRGSTWILDSIDEVSYRYTVDNTRETERELFSMNGSGDNTVITNAVIGRCPWCSAIHFPLYLKGVLQLYYSNGEVVEVQIKSSDDFRKPSQVVEHALRCHSSERTGNYHFLLNGRKVPDDIQKTVTRRVRHILVTDARNGK